MPAGWKTIVPVPVVSVGRQLITATRALTSIVVLFGAVVTVAIFGATSAVPWNDWAANGRDIAATVSAIVATPSNKCLEERADFDKAEYDISVSMV